MSYEKKSNIKFVLKVNRFISGIGFNSYEDVFEEKELSKVLSLISGMVTECLVSKKFSVGSIRLTKIIDTEHVPLILFDMSEFNYRYVLLRKDDKNEKNNVNNNTVVNWDVFT